MVSTSMNALIFDGPAPDASRTAIRRVATPRPKPGQVLLEVAHAAVNFKDVMARRGDNGYVDSWPFLPGLEAAGTVVATGTGVTSLRVGDRVAALTNAGGLAEYALASAELAAVIPDTVSTAEAATAPGALTTAALLVDQFGQVRDGDVVMVHSAAGAVGTAVAAIARTYPGVVLVGTVGDDTRTAAARVAGYDVVLTRGPDLAHRIRTSVARGVDVVLDPQGTTELDTDLAVLSAAGRIVIFGNAAGGPVDDLAVRRLLAGNAAVGGFSLAALSAQRPELVARTIASVLQRQAEGTLHLDSTELRGLHHVPAAHDALATGRGATKYVVSLHRT